MSNDPIRRHVYAYLSEKSTEELLETWRKNDRFEWTGLAFDVIQELLIEREADIPGQNEPIWEYRAKDAINDDLEEPTIFYKPGQVVRLCEWINRVIIAAPVLFYTQELIRLPGYVDLIRAYLPDFFIRDLLAWVFALIYTNVVVVIGFLFIYFPLKGLATVLQILMDMDLRTRSSKLSYTAGE
jgi:hypothetical protein